MAPESEGLSGDLIGPVMLEGMATSASAANHKKGPPPKLGEMIGSRWGDSQLTWHTMPGGGVVQFDLNRLTLGDFRMMRDHYQVNASLSVLTFMMHQLDWKIECDNEKIRKYVQGNMDRVWTRLVRAMSTAFWAGFSPNVLQWENDIDGRAVTLTKIKDLLPEESCVHWKTLDGWAPPGHTPPKVKVYDGISQIGGPYPIPVDNSFWYPLLMQNTDYYGKKLLRPAFTSWYFSIIMHLFSNRYFERFGEPVPVGRAPFDEELGVDGKKMSGREMMMGVLQALRNRSAVVLPDTRSGQAGHEEYDYQIEYLESQMRGADFERYLMRLDEEISLSLFTPLLMLRTADVGSYNLGVTHVQAYQQMLNALAGDWKEYIDSYVIDKMVRFNFGLNAPRAEIKFRKLGDDKFDLMKIMIQQLLVNGTAKPDLAELGNIAGLTFEEVQVITAPAPAPGSSTDPNGDPAAASANAKQVTEEMYSRIEAQIRKGGKLDLGYQKKYESALVRKGLDAATAKARYSSLTAFVDEVTQMPSPGEEILSLVKQGIESSIEG